MARKKELSEYLRQRVVQVYREVTDYEAFSMRYEVPVAKNQSAIGYCRKFSIVKNLHGRGRKCKKYPKLVQKYCWAVSNNI